MWRIAKDNSLSRNLTSHTNFPLLLRTSFSQLFPSFLQNACLDPELRRSPRIRQLGSAENSSSCIKEHGFSRFCEYQVKSVSLQVRSGRLNLVKGFGSAAEVVASSTDEDVSPMEEIQGGVMRDFKQHDASGRKKKEEEKFAAPNNNKMNFGDMSYPRYYALKRRQAKIETEAWDNAAKEYRELILDMCDKKLAPNLPYVKSLFLGWFEPLKAAIAAEQKAWKQGKKQKITYGPYIDQLPADKMAIITMHKLMALLMSGGGSGSVRIVQASLQIGEAVEYETRVHRFMESTKKNGKKGDEDFEEETDTTSKESKFLLKKVTNMIKQKKVFPLQRLLRTKDDTEPWGLETQAKIGCRLLDLMMETAYIQPPLDQSIDGPPDIRPAFRHALKCTGEESNTKRYGVIECDPLIIKGLEKTARHMVIPYMPMLIPPLYWTGYNRGAHLFLPSHLVRTHGSYAQREALKKTSPQQMKTVFEALDMLGSTKWRVNKRVLSVIDRIWSSGGCIGGLVDSEDVPIPEKPDTKDEEELKKWRWDARHARKENTERHSQRCDTELKLAVARNMKDEEGFYYPHNLDFRGRAYPMHPHLNHLGSDLCRGILEFAEGRPLGRSGLHWLKIHIANLYAGGVDKLSHEGRLSFVENHLEDIFDSADRPLEGSKWWLGAEDPFQCLAACINLTEALRSPSPERTVSRTPVHQDGSCNGLQHYAALGRDKLGAASVNLYPGEKPADVYSGIAERVLNIMKRDAEKDPATYPNAAKARLLVDQVDRKLVKQTVMTSVYGVTFAGARAQIQKRLKERGVMSNEDAFSSSFYAATITLTALEEMFEAARSIMDWLGNCAKIIASANESVAWTTPLGLPVYQPYRKKGRIFIKTSLQVICILKDTDKVEVKRQRTAFAPNFVHSLDGSHMMMTAIACKKAGLIFAGVHDSYWTHACDVETMNKILREKFVELYEQPILEELLEQFQTSFPSLVFPPLPERGDFDLKEVLQSEYFFN